jgi:pectinesterase
MRSFLLPTIVILLSAYFVESLAVSLAGATSVGSGGKYANLTAALKDTNRFGQFYHHFWIFILLNLIPSNVYYVHPGTYAGQVTINRPDVTIYGDTSSPNSYGGNKVTLTGKITASSAGSNDGSATLRVLAPGVKLYNLNIANTYGKVSADEFYMKHIFKSRNSRWIKLKLLLLVFKPETLAVTDAISR